MTREKAIKILREIIDEGWLISDFDKCIAIDACEMAIKALEQESCEDCISREQTLKAFAKECNGECACCKYNGSGYDTAENCKLIKSMSSVIPQPKTGHWIKLPYMAIEADGTILFSYVCSSCNGVGYFRRSEGKVVGGLFCPNCGCRMEGVGE